MKLGSLSVIQSLGVVRTIYAYHRYKWDRFDRSVKTLRRGPGNTDTKTRWVNILIVG
jgi:hypothetical protein